MVFADADVGVEAEVVAAAVRGKLRGDCQRGCCCWSCWKFRRPIKEHEVKVCTVLPADVLFHVDHFGAVFHC